MGDGNKYLSTMLKNGEFEILSAYLPQALFFETNLPYVQVNPERKASTPEPPELVLSYLTPGRVTFRYDDAGHVILFFSAKNDPALGVIKGYSTTTSSTIFLREIDICDRKADFNIIREVRLEKFYESDPRGNKYSRIGFSTTKLSLYSLMEFLNKNREPMTVAQLTSKSASYPRIGAYVDLYRDYYSLSLLENLLHRHLRLEEFAAERLVKYFYAIDMKASYKVVTDATTVADLQRSLRAKTHYRSFSKVFTTSPSSPARNIQVYGYEVKNTGAIRIHSERLEDFLEWGSDVEGDLKEYFDWTLNQVIASFVKFVVRRDLTVNLIAGGSKEMMSLLDVTTPALMLQELDGRLIIHNLDNIGEVLEEGFTQISSSVDSESVSLKPYIVTLILSRDTEVFKRVKNISLEDIRKLSGTMQEALSKTLRQLEYYDVEPRLAITNLILLHSVSHHLARVISRFSGVSSQYLGEQLEIQPSRVRALIFEHVNGGGGGIKTFKELFDISEEAAFNAVEHILLSMGECLNGTPEDILYYSSRGKKLPIQLTPLEFRESDVVKTTFEREVEMFKKMWMINNECDLRRDIIKLMEDCDSLLGRFASTNEILLCALKDLSNYSCLRRLLVEIASHRLSTRGLRREDVDNVLTLIQASLNFTRRKQMGIREREVIKRIINVARAVLIKLVPRSCNSACGMCYHNQSFCKFKDPMLQPLLVNRRLLKLFGNFIITSYYGEAAASGRGYTIASVEINGVPYDIRIISYPRAKDSEI